MNIFESWLVNSYIADGGIVGENLENTLPAILMAVKDGYPIKIDVQMLSDSTIICFKNSQLKQHTQTNGYVTNLTKEDIESITLTDGNKIPTFQDVLDNVNGKVPLLINIVNNTTSTKLENIIAKSIKKYDGEVAVCSTNPNSVKYFSENYSDIVCGITVENFENKLEGSYKSKRLKKLKYNKIACPQFIVYESTLLPNRHVKKYTSLPLIASTVISQEEYLKLVKYCDNITFRNFYPEI